MKRIYVLLLFFSTIVLSIPPKKNQGARNAETIATYADQGQWSDIIKILDTYNDATKNKNEYQNLLQGLKKNKIKNVYKIKISSVDEPSNKIEFAYSIIHKSTPINVLKKFIEIDKKYNTEELKKSTYDPDQDPISIFWSRAPHSFFSLFYYALEYGTPEQVELLFKLAEQYKIPYKLLINQRDGQVFSVYPEQGLNDKPTEIHITTMAGNLDVLKKLTKLMPLEKKDFENNQAGRNMTPLLMAAGNGYGDMVKYLIEEQNANIMAVDDLKRNVLQFAVKKPNQKELITYLIEKKPALLTTDAFKYANNNPENLSTLADLAQKNGVTIDYIMLLETELEQKNSNPTSIDFFLQQGADPKGITDKALQKKLSAHLSDALGLKTLAQALHALG
jgi:ankyrin repeat protein